MPTLQATAPDFLQAREHLSRFVHQQAASAAGDLGFGWIGATDAPSTYPQLLAAVDHSRRTGEPLPISNRHCEDTVYLTSADNIAARFWHDVNHVRHELNFGLVDELELSLWHLRELEQAGHPRDSLVWRLLHADLTGQVYVQAFASRFPLDQRRFISGCVTTGFDHGLLAELRRGDAL